ncbi:MAG: MBOAT family protein [Bacteroidales bacterium]|nr:MBOAT family protein [Bacteroidales bacterium]
MIFNSINFAIFLPVVFLLYWFATNRNLRLQNNLLLVSSYFFYACWDWRFLFLLVFSTLLDYFTGIKIHEAKNKKQRLFWLWLSIGVNLGFLGVFKYYNFFAASFANGLSLLGVNANLGSLNVILPVGISFYTFHGLSYVIDLYNDRIKPEKNFIDYSVFVSFFPLLVAGPIERATHLLPQILKKREFDASKAADGLRQILWGLFKKMVIADNCAEYANTIFNNSSEYSGATLALGSLFFAFQIYCDFSGYSDIALGAARLFGIDLLRNFAFPYFSRDIAEFWRRWHISLSSWFRDYLYIPLGGSKGGIWMKIRNTFIIFLVSGFWHGANWTFIMWGFLNALFIMPSIIFKTNRNNLEIVAKGKYLPSIKDFLSICLTFSLTLVAWIFFRANTMHHAFNYIQSMFTGLLHKSSYIAALSFLNLKTGYYIPVLMLLFIIIEWVGREQQYALAKMGLNWHKQLRWAVYYTIVFAILYFGGKEQQFIYFQF